MHFNMHREQQYTHETWTQDSTLYKQKKKIAEWRKGRREREERVSTTISLDPAVPAKAQIPPSPRSAVAVQYHFVLFLFPALLLRLALQKAQLEPQPATAAA